MKEIWVELTYEISIELTYHDDIVRIQQFLVQKHLRSIEIRSCMKEHREWNRLIDEPIIEICAGCSIVSPIGQHMIKIIGELTSPRHPLYKGIHTLGQRLNAEFRC